MKHFASILFILSIGLFGCDSDDGNNNKNKNTDDGSVGNLDAGADAAEDSSTPQPDPLANVVDIYVEGICNFITSCHFMPDSRGEGPGMLSGVIGGSMALCKKELPFILGTEEFGPIQAALEDGSVKVDADDLKACLADFADECRYFITGDGEGKDGSGGGFPCMHVFEGTIDDGDDCNISEQCKGSSYCDTDGGDECPGECKSAFEDGSFCLNDAECADGSLCYQFTCRKLRKTDAGDKDDACGLSIDEETDDLVALTCGADLFCPDGRRAPTCEEEIAAEANCNFSDACDHGYRCAQTGVQPSCQPMGVKNNGDECGEGDVCSPSENQICSVQSGECELQGDGTPGAACGENPIAERAGCADGNYCNGEGNQCAKQVPVGAACWEDRMCESGSCFDGLCAAEACGRDGFDEQQI